MSSVSFVKDKLQRKAVCRGLRDLIEPSAGCVLKGREEWSDIKRKAVCHR